MLSQAARKDPAMSGQLSYDRVEGDFYPTPQENVDCLAHFVDLSDEIIWEPACGEGHISKRIFKFCKGVYSTDLYDRGFGHAPCDFLKQDRMPNIDCNMIVTNPPFADVAEEFIRRALILTAPTLGKVAMFMRNEYDMASSRDDLFEGHPAFRMKIAVTKRPRWFEGSKGSPRHNFAWYFWDWGDQRIPGQGAEIHYIHPKNANPIKKEICN